MDASEGDLNLYAWNLLTCEAEDLRDPKAALDYAKKAVELSEEKQPAILDTLARALFLNGKLPEAIQVQEKALSLLPAEPSTPYEIRLSEQLEAQMEELRKAQKKPPR